MLKTVFHKIQPLTEPVYNSQVGAILFMCSVVFKVSSLPGIVYREGHSSTLWLFMLMAAIDLIAFALMYNFFKDGEDENLKDSTTYKLGLAVFALYLCGKFICYYAFSVVYLSVELFSGIEPLAVVACFLLPVTYFGVKGVRTIARACEITLFVAVVLLLVNLVFLKTEMDVGRNLPVLALEPSEFTANSFRYGLWLGDIFPLAFVRVRNKKLPYVGFSTFAACALVLVVVFFGVAMYGEALPLVESVIIRTAGFNQLSLEIGRMEWTVLFVVMIMAVFELSLLFYGITECAARITKRKLPFQIFIPVALIVVAFSVPSLNVVTDAASLRPVGYTWFALTLLIPIYLNILKHLREGRLTNLGEYKRLPGDSSVLSSTPLLSAPAQLTVSNTMLSASNTISAAPEKLKLTTPENIEPTTTELPSSATPETEVEK